MSYVWSWASAPKYKSKEKQPRAAKLQSKKEEAKQLTSQQIENICRDAIHKPCGCGRYCLNNVGDTNSKSLSMMVEYMTPWMAMPQKEHRDKFFPILEGCARGVTEGGHLSKR
jgi:hypothetical protein